MTNQPPRRTRCRSLLTLLCLAVPTTARAAPAFSGQWNVKVPDRDGDPHEGTMYLAGDGGVVCGIYDFPNYSDGFISGKVVGDKVEGLWTEDKELGGFSFAFAGNVFKGTSGNTATAKTGEKGKDYWNGTRATPAKPAYPISTLKTADIVWNSLEKFTIKFTIKGSAVTGVMTYKYSGEPGGTLRGTLTGNHLVGTWKGTEGGGRFQLLFNTGSRSVTGTYASSSQTSCNDDGGLITGGWN